MTPIETAVPHISASELSLIAKEGSVEALDPRAIAHLESCDECLMLLADYVTQNTPEETLRDGAAPSLRAVNLAAARWRADLAKSDAGQPLETAPQSREARLEVLLGTAAGPGQAQSPLLALFVGKKQARP
jgi:hypothetical protein